MPDLYPTKTRLALLQAVAADLVIEGLTEETHGHTWLTDEIDPPRKVSARVTELHRAGWVELDYAQAFWRLTDEGRRVLGAGGQS